MIDWLYKRSKREKLWRDYLEHCSEHSYVGFAWNHGIRCSNEDFLKGVEFRRKLGLNVPSEEEIQSLLTGI